MLNLHCISIFAYDLGTSNEAGLDETPALADHNKRVLSQQELAWTQLGSRSHSQQEKLSMICLIQSPAKKGNKCVMVPKGLAFGKSRPF